MIPGDLLSAFPHTVPHTTRHFRQSGCTVKLLSQRMCAIQGGSLFHFYDGIWYELAGRKPDMLTTNPT